MQPTADDLAVDLVSRFIDLERARQKVMSVAALEGAAQLMAGRVEA